MTNYVSSESNRYKRTKLNNVILSLNCFVSCTTNDKTIQDYGTLCYKGSVAVGQVIAGDRVPRKAGTPIIYNNTYLGQVDNDGNLVVTNNCMTTSALSVENCYTGITYTLGNNENWGNSYSCDLVSCTSCTTCSTCDGYNVETTCTTFCYCIQESNQFYRPYTVYDEEWYEEGCRLSETGRFGMSDGKLYAYVTCCNDAEGHTYCWCWPNLSCFCNGKTCFENMPPEGLMSEELTCHCQLDRCIYRVKGCNENFSLRMTAIQCCTVCTILCRKQIDYINLDVRYL